MTLNKEALEAAEQQFAPKLSDDMKAHLHRAVERAVAVADLVPRTHKRPTAALQNALDERDEARQRKDAGYLERNQVVALLARLFPSGIRQTAIEGWDEEWHGCVYIDLPTGQVSWHYHDSHAHLFADLPPYFEEYDGHTTEAKYKRVQAVDAADLVPRKIEAEAQRIMVEQGKQLAALREAAHNLYDNRVGHRPGNKLWSAHKDFWEGLCRELPTVSKGGGGG